MTKEELKNLLRDNLEINLSLSYNLCGEECVEVALYFDNDLITLSRERLTMECKHV